MEVALFQYISIENQARPWPHGLCARMYIDKIDQQHAYDMG